MLDLIAPIDAIQKQVQKGLLKAGHTTQFVVGAAGETDLELLKTTNWLYQKKGLKRAYFSAYIPPASTPYPLPPTPLLREHRLYQADWLMRFYEFKLEDLVLQQDFNLSLELDPKMVAALKYREQFPVEVNTVPYKTLLRIPGIGPTAAKRIWRVRREHRFTDLNELKNVGVVVKRAKPFILLNGRKQGDIKSVITTNKQLSLFSS
jgi:predicted DNA-binding helix-hairpin-helix protein